MPAICQPLPQSVAEEMLQVVARALCDRPDDTSAQRESRIRQMVHSTAGFEPRDGLEYMLSGLVFGHFNLILDSMRQVFEGQVDAMNMRSKTTIVALDRSLFMLLKELRIGRTRPLAKRAEDVRAAAAAAPKPSPVEPAQPAEPAAPDEAAVAPSLASATEMAINPAEATPPAAAMLDPAADSPAVAGSVAIPDPAQMTPSSPGQAHVMPDQAPEQAAATTRQVTSAGGRPAKAAKWPGLQALCATDDGTIQNHIVAFEAALAAAVDTQGEARAFEEANADARSANGD